MSGKPAVQRLIKGQANATLTNAAENVLDATHTHFTHKMLLRGLTSRRYQVNVEVTGGPGWVEVTYIGEEKQTGLVSAFLDGSRTKGVGRYRHPGIAELEYWEPKGLVLSTTFHMRQTT